MLLTALLLQACSNSYKNLQAVSNAKNDCVIKFQPTFKRALYNTQVNILHIHLSGLLLIKQMPDSSTRLVFSTETGFKFFDFEFDHAGAFTVYYIIDKMNRKAVVNTLRNDFELALMKHIANKQPAIFKKDHLLFYRYGNNDAFDYYITDSSCNKLVRIEKAGKKKSSMQMIMNNYNDGIPDSIGITHKHLNFNIGLKLLKPGDIETNSTQQ